MTASTKFTFQALYASSQDVSFLESVTATAGRECNIQDARGSGLCCYGGLWRENKESKKNLVVGDIKIE